MRRWSVIIVNKLEDICQNLKVFRTYEECKYFIENNYEIYKKDHISDYVFRNSENRYFVIYIIPIYEGDE